MILYKLLDSEIIQCGEQYHLSNPAELYKNKICSLFRKWLILLLDVMSLSTITQSQVSHCWFNSIVTCAIFLYLCVHQFTLLEVLPIDTYIIVQQKSGRCTIIYYDIFLESAKCLLIFVQCYWVVVEEEKHQLKGEFCSPMYSVMKHNCSCLQKSSFFIILNIQNDMICYCPYC